MNDAPTAVQGVIYHALLTALRVLAPFPEADKKIPPCNGCSRRGVIHHALLTALRADRRVFRAS